MNFKAFRKALGLGLLGLFSGCFLDLGTPVPPGYDPLADAGARAGFDALFNPELEHNLILTMTETEWMGLGTDMEAYKQNFGNLKTGNLRRAQFTYQGAAGRVTLGDVGIRTRGNTSRAYPENPGNLEPGNQGIISQAHFQLKFNEPFGLNPGTQSYKDRKDRRFFTLNTLALKSAVGNGPSNFARDQSLIREMYAYNFLNRAGVNSSRASLVTLSFQITDEAGNPTRTLYFGPYTAIEPINEVFLQRRLGLEASLGNLYKCLWQSGGPASLEEPHTYDALGWDNPNILGSEDWTRNYRPSYDLNTNAENPDHRPLKDFVAKINQLSGRNLKTFLDQHFEVDKFLRWTAANVVLGMPDDYWAMGNNYYLYFYPVTQKAEFMPYDYDHSLGAGWMPFDTTNADIFTWFDNTSRTQIFTPKILAIPEYRDQYIQYLKEFTGLTPGSASLDYGAFQAQHQKILAHLARPNPVLPGKTRLQGLATFWNSATKTVSTWDFVPGLGSYLADYFTGKKASVSGQLGGATATLTSTSWQTPSGLGTGWVNFPIPLGGGSFTAQVDGSQSMAQVKWETSTDPTATNGGGATPWTDLGTSPGPLTQATKAISFPANHAEGGVFLRATVSWTAGGTRTLQQKITLHQAVAGGAGVQRSGGNVTFRWDRTWPWTVAKINGRSISGVRALGDFNAWGNGNPWDNGLVMNLTGDVFSATTSASAGQQYKIWVRFSDNSEEWLTDMTSPLQTPSTWTPNPYNSITPP